MLGNEDNSNIEINVNKGGNRMSEGTVAIGRSEYKQVLELAYKAAMLKEAVLNCAALYYDVERLYIGNSTDIMTIFKYAFPDDYEKKLHELQEKKTKEDEDDER